MRVIVGTDNLGYVPLTCVKVVIPGDKESLFIWKDGTETKVKNSIILAIDNEE